MELKPLLAVVVVSLGLVCSATAQNSQPGTLCAFNSQCSSGHCCLLKDQKFHQCYDSDCPLLGGEVCTQDSQCRSSKCCSYDGYSVCSETSVCLAPPGGACTGNKDCLSDKCCKTENGQLECSLLDCDLLEVSVTA